MDECLLYDLIECSVCLERLDGNSKVLPCQHTFCKPCLEEIVLSRKELRCPECRVLVETKVDDLPCNILLIRILDGMKNAPRNATLTSTSTQITSTTATVATVQQVQPAPAFSSPKVEGHLQQHKQSNQFRPPYARALYAYDARESGDLQFKKGDVIVLRKKVDHNWFQGELGDKQGYVPASYVQVISGQPPLHIPQCRALYDFKMNDSNEKDCLSFAKGEIITVIRRIDENWAEGKLKDRIGIFPMSFVEMNSPARSLMKLSTNLNPGPSRVAPPTPSSDSDTTPLITASSTQGVRGGTQQSVTACPSSSASTSLSSSSSSSNSSASASSTTTSTSTSSTNSSSSTPSPASPPRVRGRPSTGTVSEPVASVPSSTPPWNPQYREKRHSMTAMPAPMPLPVQGQVAPPVAAPTAQHRRSLEVLDTHESGSVSTTGIKRCVQSAWSGLVEGSPPSTAHQSQSPQPISLFVALYPYKPQKDDELELRKGELYTVTEKCQDGWFKGASIVSRRSGVFPGNYVQVAKSSLLQVHFRQAGSSSVANIRPAVVSRTGSLPHPSHSHGQSRGCCRSVRGGGTEASDGGNAGLGRVRSAATAVSERTQGFLDWARSVTALTASPSLSASSRQSARPCSSSASNNNDHFSPRHVRHRSQGGAPELPPRVLGNPASGSAMVPPPAATQATARSVSQSWDGTSSPPNLCQPPPRAPAPTQSTIVQIPAQAQVPMSSSNASGRSMMSAASEVTPPNVTVASAGSPQVWDNKSDKKDRKDKEVLGLMKRFASKKKCKSPPPSAYLMDNPVFVDCVTGGHQAQTTATVTVSSSHSRSESCPSEVVFDVGPGHKKTNSLDVDGDKQNVKCQHAKYPAPLVRERFRCIVPYPPNSEYELELRVGDIIYVHKKREDGWFKGTLQRTGKTGLFPGSFVETF